MFGDGIGQATIDHRKQKMITKSVYQMPLCAVKKLTKKQIVQLSMTMHPAFFSALVKAWQR